ncbi:MAG TPA: hypothetical protein VFW40_14135 [Capsulimonadaceae bacterium]|nr:hypothetical protein [Capsulimonadaceae bacterium]
MNKRKIFTLIGTAGLLAVLGTAALETPSYAQHYNGRAHYQNGRMHNQEPHPRMDAAIQQLSEVRDSLQGAAQDYHGHRVRAISLIDRAISELRQGLGSDHR